MALLYDLGRDPGETENLAEQHPEVVARLTAAHDRWSAALPRKPILPAIRSTLADMHGETVQLFF